MLWWQLCTFLAYYTYIQPFECHVTEICRRSLGSVNTGSYVWLALTKPEFPICSVAKWNNVSTFFYHLGCSKLLWKNNTACIDHKSIFRIHFCTILYYIHISVLYILYNDQCLLCSEDLIFPDLLLTARATSCGIYSLTL